MNKNDVALSSLGQLRKLEDSGKSPTRIRIKDHVNPTEFGMGGLKGYVIFGKGRHKVEYTDPYGRKAVRTEFEEVDEVLPNIVPIGGYQFAFDKLFNIGLDEESTLRVGDLNDESPQMKIGVPRDAYKSIHYNAETSITESGIVVNPGVNIPAMNFVFGFMMGDGGAKEDNMTAIAPNYKNRSLYRPVPFRMSNDGIAIPNGKYFGRAESYKSDIGDEPIISSYVKLFDDPRPRIVHVWVTDNPDEFSIVDDTVFASTSSLAIESYVEMNISVDMYDGRGHAAATNSTPRVNEFGLVSGWYNAEYDDYEAIRLFTHFTRPSITLSEGDSVEAIYRLYGR